jgi:hypothetical protein
MQCSLPSQAFRLVEETDNAKLKKKIPGPGMVAYA